MEEILAEVRADAGLVDRVEEATAYADEIRESAREAFAASQAGAELAAAGAGAALALASLASRLNDELEQATTNEAVDEALSMGQQRLASQTRSRNRHLDEIIEIHGLASAEG